MNIELMNGRHISNWGDPYFIAELASNHNGDMDLAKQMIKKAKESGADCVKFQSWTKNTIFSKVVYQQNSFLKDDYRNRKDYTLEEIVEKFSVSEEQLMTLKVYCEEIGIDFATTPFSEREVDFLCNVLKPPFIKIASMDLNNYPFLDYVARKQLPIVISTGLSELYEIDEAIRVIEASGNRQIIILHCVSTYPTPESDVNLKRIETLRNLYQYPVGFSDHSLGISIPLASIAMGACIVEKHMTLDREMFGWDHKISALPDEMASICREGKRIWQAVGDGRIHRVESEERLEAFRRSIVSARLIKKGEIINANDLDFKRPGNGFKPGLAKFIIGRTAKRDIPVDKVLDNDDF